MEKRRGREREREREGTKVIKKCLFRRVGEKERK